MSETDKHSTKVEAASLRRGAKIAMGHLQAGDARTAMDTLDRMIKTSDGHRAVRAAAERRASEQAAYPIALDRAALEATLAAARPAVQIGGERRAMIGEVQAMAAKRKADAGWAFVATLSTQQVATLVGTHVENVTGAVRKLAEGGAKPDQAMKS
jgi:hypothetical protein